MAETATVSVVIPTKGRPEMLRRAVSSVLDQTYAPIELIVIDDASAKPARAAIADLPTGGLERFAVHRHEENQGAAAARNTGLWEARGQYVAFLDDDDWWLPEKLEKQVEAIRTADGAVGVAFTGNRKLDADGETLHKHIRTTDGDLSEKLLYSNYIGTFSVILFDRELVDTVGTLDERFPAWQDWEYYVRLAQHAEFVAVPEVLVNRDIDHEDRISPGYEAKCEIAPIMFEDCLRGPAIEHGVERRVRGSMESRLGRAAWLERRLGAARSHYVRAIRIYPYDRSFWVFLAALSGGSYTMRVARAVNRGLVRLRDAMGRGVA